MICMLTLQCKDVALGFWALFIFLFISIGRCNHRSEVTSGRHGSTESEALLISRVLENWVSQNFQVMAGKRNVVGG